jgi:hypothetical protein
MADILIKGMEMPKGFTDVRIYADGRVISRTLLSFGEEIATAVPVPDHGRLIDADALIRDWPTGLVKTADVINNAPTIIPADGKDTDVPTREEEI